MPSAVTWLRTLGGKLGHPCLAKVSHELGGQQGEDGEAAHAAANQIVLRCVSRTRPPAKMDDPIGVVHLKRIVTGAQQQIESACVPGEVDHII